MDGPDLLRATFWTVFFTSWIGHVYCLTMLAILTEPKRVHESFMRDLEQQRQESASANAGAVFVSSGSKGSDGATGSASTSSAGARASPGHPYAYRTSIAAGSSMSSGTMVGSLRCRSCGCHSDAKGVASPVMTQPRRDDGLIGFHAALMDLDEASNERDSPRETDVEGRQAQDPKWSDWNEEIAPVMDLRYDDPNEATVGAIETHGVAHLDTRVLDHGRGTFFEMSARAGDSGFRIS